MTWTVRGIPREDPPGNAGERETLEGFLDYHRDTLLQKSSGLSPGQLRLAAVEPSNLSLLGLVRHMTEVECVWFCARLDGRSDPPFYWRQDRPDADFEEVDAADPDEVFERYRAAVESAKTSAAAHGLGDTFEHHGATTSLRWIYVHMIEEYARHNGHADLLRERIDGETGE